MNANDFTMTAPGQMVINGRMVDGDYTTIIEGIEPSTMSGTIEDFVRAQVRGLIEDWAAVDEVTASPEHIYRVWRRDSGEFDIACQMVAEWLRDAGLTPRHETKTEYVVLSTSLHQGDRWHLALPTFFATREEAQQKADDLADNGFREGLQNLRYVRHSRVATLAQAEREIGEDILWQDHTAMIQD